MSAGPQINGIESLPWSRLVKLTETGRLDEDIACRKCAYNLRGLFPDSICPECATDIRVSILRDYLKYADPVWLRKLASGLEWIIASAAMTVVLAVLALTAGHILEITDWLWLGPSTWKFLLLAGMARGCWLFTEREPHQSERERAMSARRMTRFSLCSALVLLLTELMPVTFELSSIRDFVATIIFAWPLCLIMRAREIAARLPDPWLVKLWSLLGLLIICVAAGQVFLVVSPVGYLSFANTAFCLIAPGLFALVVLATSAATMLRVHLDTALKAAIRFRAMERTD